jgi:SAM-dependent methyltransferase
MDDSWKSGIDYERYMGRWSALIGRQFLDWLEVPAGRTWLDVGCGTGSLTTLILETRAPADIFAIDASPAFISHAQSRLTDPRIHFKVGLAQSLELEPSSVDVVVSGLVLNFVPDPMAALREMRRVARPGGEIGVFAWDYAQGMQMLRRFWDAGIALDPACRELDEGPLFPVCREGQLEVFAREAGITDVQPGSIEALTRFSDFDDYWEPFLGNVGPGGAYVKSLSEPARNQLKERLRETLPIDADGSITLSARAWAIKGRA